LVEVEGLTTTHTELISILSSDSPHFQAPGSRYDWAVVAWGAVSSNAPPAGIDTIRSFATSHSSAQPRTVIKLREENNRLMKLNQTRMRLLAAIFACSSVCAADTLEVSVSAKGAAVKGLTAKDFKVTLDGKDQPVTDAYLGKEATGDKARTQNYIMLFDVVTLKAAEHTDLRRQLQPFVDSAARADRTFGVLTYAGTIRQIQGFTNEASAIKAGVDKAVSGAVSVAVDWRNFIDAIAGLARALGPMPGRKTVLFFTNGQLAAVNTADNTVSSRGVPQNSGKQAETSGEIDKLVDILKAADVVVHTISHNSGVDRNLTDGTKGNTVRVNNNLPDLLTKILDEQDATYVLDYTPSGNLKAGCHKVAVKVAAAGDVKTRQLVCD